MKTIAVLLLVIISNFTFASDYQADIDLFFESLEKGEVDIAVDKIYSSNPYVSAIPDGILNIKNQLKALPGIVGKLNKLEKIDTYKVGETLVQVTYIATYDRQPVRFEFQYFKLNDGWRINSMSFDDAIFEKVSELARDRAFSKMK